MATQTEICNLMLIRIGEPPITGPGDGSKAGDLCAAIWNLMVEEVLRAHAWKFATKRAQLTKETAAPVWGYACEYTLPVDCLRFLGINEDNEIDYRVEQGTKGKAVFCDEGGPINVMYVARVTKESQFDPNFISALAWRLAWELAFALSALPEVVKAAAQGYKDSLPTAKAVDSQENPAGTLVSNVWIDSRR